MTGSSQRKHSMKRKLAMLFCQLLQLFSTYTNGISSTGIKPIFFYYIFQFSFSVFCVFKSSAYFVLSVLLFVYTDRDLKPENLLLTSHRDNCVLKLADFGFAMKLKHRNDNSCRTPCGSPSYMAPEIICKRAYGMAVDMWALGCITYFLLGGYPPFHSDNPEKILRLVVKSTYECLPKQWSHVSVEAKEFISSLLIKNPSERMTVEKALSHPWLDCTPRDLRNNQLDSNLERMKHFRAIKLSSCALAVLVINRLKHIWRMKRQANKRQKL